VDEELLQAAEDVKRTGTIQELHATIDALAYGFSVVISQRDTTWEMIAEIGKLIGNQDHYEAGQSWLVNSYAAIIDLPNAGFFVPLEKDE
jgi:hypothetical protein